MNAQLETRNREPRDSYMFRHLVIFSVVFIWQLGTAHAQFRKVGTTGYVFLEIPVSARMAAMGESFLAMTDAGADALFTNPGLLGFARGRHHLQATHADYLANIQHQAFGYAALLGNLGAFGVSLNRLDVGEMIGTVNADPNNPGGRYIITGTFDSDALAVGLTYARRLTDRFSFGTTLRYVRERIATFESTNVLLDAGMVYLTGWRSLRIGGYVQSFGVDSKYIGDTFKMPTIFRLGVASEVLGSTDGPTRLTLTAEALHPSDYTERLHLGGEYWFQNFLAVRGGYKCNYDEEGWTAGVGLRWKTGGGALGLDMAYTGYGRLGSVSRFTLIASF
ncbi:MAG: PorV/PorQ family protein [Candidatus Oleimicrobiaceae bacterium]